MSIFFFQALGSGIVGGLTSPAIASGSGSAPPFPANAYLTEDGSDNYVAEDGTTPYVDET